MTDIKVYGELLATEDNRVLRYRLLPFGSIGRTNVGAVLASEKSVEIPEDLSHLTLNLEHNQMAPVGRFVSITKGEDGLYATVSISKFPRGDEALALTASKSLTGISVEVAGAIIQDGKLVGGELVGAALCKTPAFPDALLMASNTDEVQEALAAVQTSLDSLSEALETTSETPVEEEIETPEETLTDSSEEEEEINPKEESTMENSAIPSALTASNDGSAEVKSFDQGVKLIASAMKNRDKALIEAINEAGIAGETNMFAALSNVTSTTAAGTAPNGWLGEVWLQNPYQRKFVPLFSQAALTNWTMTGWKFGTTPLVDTYAGFPAQPPSRAVTTTTFTVTAERLASANSLDRKFKDFPADGEFLAAFYRAQAEEYARVSDAKALAALTAGASTVAGSTVPAGVNATVSQIVDGAFSILNADLDTPTAALIPLAAYKTLLLSRNEDSLQFLGSALGLEGGNLAGFQIIPTSAVSQVHVVTKNALTYYELPGTPIRAEVETIANGGFDTGIFGYYATQILDNRGVVKVTPAV